MAFTPYLDPRLAVVAYRAPIEYGFGGYAWFGIEWLPEGRRVDVAEAQASLTRLVDELEGLRDELKPKRLVLGGFSQGAMMSLGVALDRPDLIDGGLLMSGHPWPSVAEGLTALPFLVQHGVRDDVLPVESGRQVRDVLVGRGAEVDYREYPMGHEVSMASLQDAIAWLGRFMR